MDPTTSATPPTPSSDGGGSPSAVRAMPDGSTSDAAGVKVARVLCPYCGRGTPMGARCESCRGLLDPLSRQATQNAMGPWFIHDAQNPYRPGCSFETICDMIRRGKIAADTVVRGPTTRQYWMPASRVPSIANRLGSCHNCQKPAEEGDPSCGECGADFSPELDRQFLGLGPVYLLPGQATPEQIAQSHAQVARGGPANAGSHHGHAHKHAAAAPPSESAGSDGVAGASKGSPSRDRDTGEYQALLNRIERLDAQVGTSRLLLITAVVVIIGLAAAVLWFAGVFGGTPTSTPSVSSQNQPGVQGSGDSRIEAPVPGDVPMDRSSSEASGVAADPTSGEPSGMAADARTPSSPDVEPPSRTPAESGVNPQRPPEPTEAPSPPERSEYVRYVDAV